jgi:1,4-alpha-glucan branching enzyme
MAIGLPILTVSDLVKSTSCSSTATGARIPARDVTTSVGNCIVADPDFAWQNDFQMPLRTELVVYKMHLGTFPDDPAPIGQALNRAADELDYLRDLGINAIHLLPSAEFPVDSSWGYNPAHIFSVESAYGVRKISRDLWMWHIRTASL